ncbi:MAG: FAD-dependent oxidoreductase [Saprospiraceae bacterium]|nr:FAD-dependent oxidoreductase [Saprospiraceae bacterium]
MTAKFPTHKQVVIIGGGIVGCSVAYHLTKLGWTDVAIIERKSLTCGTTWHAPGLVGQLRATANITKLAQYTSKLYASLEEETGQATGFKQTGSIAVATNGERFEELKRGASMARVFDLEVELMTAQEMAKMWPLVNMDDVIGGVFLPGDGQTNPVDTTMALAKGAKMRGAEIFEETRVTGILRKNRVVTGVSTEKGDIRAEFVVNCGGMWGRELGRMAGVNVPLHPAEHFYFVTEHMEGLLRGAPTLRDMGGYTYYKEDGGQLTVGAFEPVAKPWGMKGIPPDFSFDTLPNDHDHMLPIFDKAIHRIPKLEETGIQLFLTGPESFTPDDRYILGEAPQLRNFFVAAGFNSIGIQSAGGAGKVLADWIVKGRQPMDLWDVDIRRFAPYQGSPVYLHDRIVEGLGLLYAMHWPFRQFETSRNVRKSPLHDRLERHGACFGEVGGWERANWFAPEGVEAKYEYTYGRQNWFDYSAEEHKAVRERVGLFDQTSFANFLLQGRGAEAVLNQVCANSVSVPVGKLVYTQWLNEEGGIEADLTVARTEEACFMIVTAGATEYKDFNWLQSHIPQDAHAVLTNVTSGYAVISLMGPRSRDLLSTLTDANMSNEAFPFGTSQEIFIGYAKVRASRITYVGELGWEIYIPTDFAQSVYDQIIERGKAFDLKHAGYHALNSLRIEKGYRHWGHDITIDDTPLEAGLGFAVSFKKEGGFIGKDALLKQKEDGVKKRLVQFILKNPEPLLYHNEPIWRNDVIVGYITSGMFGHTIGRSIGMGYVNNQDGATPEFVKSGNYEIEIACKRYPAHASLKPSYDPKNERIRC